MMTRPADVLTVVLTDYFQVAATRRRVSRGRWYRFESRLEGNTDRTLEMLEAHGATATFFVLGWIADRFPEVVRRIADQGHEIAAMGYYHHGILELPLDVFRDDLARSIAAVQNATGRRIYGHRIAHGWLHDDDLWVLDAVAEAGLAYDSSMRPAGRALSRDPARCLPHRHRGAGGELWEYPVSSLSLGGWRLPLGGNYLRQLPHSLMRRGVRRWRRSHDAPLVTYFHVWELDADQPRIAASTYLERVRHYRNLRNMPRRIADYLGESEFRSIADHLGLDLAAEPAEVDLAPQPERRARPRRADEEESVDGRIPVTVVVPCYNEERVLAYLRNTLARVEQALADTYELYFVFVDDGSTDGTWKGLQKQFGGRDRYQFHRHEENGGVAAAILSGIREASTEVVCSIDCDCTYDPVQLRLLLPELQEGVDMVTASPYHRDGRVDNVPAWRLTLSRGLSGLYRLVLPVKLATYTSCFRVYRRSSVEHLDVETRGFLGVAEMLGNLSLRGGVVVECPAVLEARLLGYSKIKTLQTILGHLGLLARLGLRRLGTGSSRSAVTAPRIEPEHEHRGMSTVNSRSDMGVGGERR